MWGDPIITLVGDPGLPIITRVGISITHFVPHGISKESPSGDSSYGQCGPIRHMVGVRRNTQGQKSEAQRFAPEQGSALF